MTRHVHRFAYGWCMRCGVQKPGKHGRLARNPKGPAYFDALYLLTPDARRGKIPR